MSELYFRKYEPIFGSWRIVEELGSGAEGHLYRISREDALGHVFYSALKAVSIPAGGADELNSMIAGGMTREEATKYFDSVLSETGQEFKLLEKLKGNSNIVSYEDHEAFRRDDGIGWDVLIRLEELTPLVRHSIYNRMDEAEIIRMGADIAKALTLCRKYGIIHRDIKPENIFVSPSGNYKLGDFGIARIIEDTTTSLSRKGTYSYMAPEVYWGRDYNHSADIYSLGIVMYKYMNDGRMPLMPVYPKPVAYRDGEEAFVKRVGGADLPAPRNGSDELKAIILKACAYEPADRYTDASEMLRDLETLARGESESAAAGMGRGAAGKFAALYAGANSAAASSGEEAQQLAGTNAKKRTSSKRAIAVAVVIFLLAAAGIAYALIPKAVTDIDAGKIEGDAEIYIGEELTPEFEVLPDWFKDEPVTVTTDNDSVVRVDGTTLHAESVGEATLTISAREYSEQSVIHVVPKVTSIEGIDKEISLTTGNTLALEPVLSPEEFSSEPVEYTVADKAVCTAEPGEKGSATLTAVAAGNTTLTVSAGGTSIEATVTVTDPVVYVPKSSGSSKKSKSKSGSGKSKKGYFDSSDDESF